ncbi:ubiquitin carboxyl-terminal hydrolase [Lipomyces arxii]|uniref:ubiquitin carboxyl-terminal hydrolase n=1 Tax=Lipomyces arxii TaxID=56418 RepID=UPI0034CEEE19
MVSTRSNRKKKARTSDIHENRTKTEEEVEPETKQNQKTHQKSPTEQSSHERIEFEGWSTVESSPEIFTDIVKHAGVTGAKVVELYSLDIDTLKYLPTIFGLVFLFKCVEDDSELEEQEPDVGETKQPWFANQVVDNACATLALLNILMNAFTTFKDSKLDIGEHLRSFYEFTLPLHSIDRGLALNSFEFMRSVNNMFATAQEIRESYIALYENYMESIGKRRTADGGDEDDDNYHFVAYIPIDKTLWELDGLKDGPIHIIDCEDSQDWTAEAAVQIQRRIERYSMGEIRFNLMAIIEDSDEQMSNLTELAKTEIALIEKRLDETCTGWDKDLAPDRKRQTVEEKLIEKLRDQNRSIYESIVFQHDGNVLLETLSLADSKLARLNALQEEQSVPVKPLDKLRPSDLADFSRELIAKLLENDAELGQLIIAAADSK